MLHDIGADSEMSLYCLLQGMYDRDGCFWKEIDDVYVMAACSLTSGAGQMLSPRFARHCTLLHKAAPMQATLRTIVSNIMDPLFQNLSDDLQPIKLCIADASIALYQEASTTFLPTPRKQHYSFTSRHVFESIQVCMLSGFAGLSACHSPQMSTTADLGHIWHHPAVGRRSLNICYVYKTQTSRIANPVPQG